MKRRKREEKEEAFTAKAQATLKSNLRRRSFLGKGLMRKNMVTNVDAFARVDNTEMYIINRERYRFLDS